MKMVVIGMWAFPVILAFLSAPFIMSLALSVLMTITRT